MFVSTAPPVVSVKRLMSSSAVPALAVKRGTQQRIVVMRIEWRKKTNHHKSPQMMKKRNQSVLKREKKDEGYKFVGFKQPKHKDISDSFVLK